jgi:hypothetical protein
MVQLADNTLEGRIARLEQQVRSLTAGNLTNNASVVDAQGNAVPLSGLAFGQVQAIQTGNGVASFTGTANTGAGRSVAPWMNGALLVNVLVKGGRLRVDWAANMSALGVQVQTIYSYTVTFLGNGAALDPALDVPANVVVPADFYRALVVYDPNNIGAIVGHGTWAFHTGLAPGWYRVRAAYQFGYASTPQAPTANVDYPRIAATPF